MDTNKKIKTTNPYSGQSIDLTAEEFMRYQINTAKKDMLTSAQLQHPKQ